MADVVDLTKVSSDDLRAELERRKKAAQAKGRPLRYATKAEWAQAQAVEIRARLAALRAEYKPGARGHREKEAQEQTLQAEIQKYDRMAKKFQREGV